jgi:2-oxoglutarate ferredoxin oxidoreductase subunit gamma
VLTAIRFAGYGGQGLLTAGMILSEAAGIYDGKFVVQTQSYGPEARGGASRSDVIISDTEVVYPKPTRLDVLVAMNEEAVDKYRKAIRAGGRLIVDSTQVEGLSITEADLVPFTGIARELGNELVANVIALGALVELTGLVSEGAMRKAVQGRVPAAYRELNLEALNRGFEAGRAVIEERHRVEEDLEIV